MEIAGQAIVLAAGRSARFGAPKALALWRGRSFVLAVTETLRGAGFSRPIVVVRSGDNAIRSQVDAQCVVAENSDPDRGMLSSLWAGLDALPVGAPWVLVALVDQPAVHAETCGQLSRAADRDPDLVHVAAHAGNEGHPVVFPARLLAALRGAALATGAQEIVNIERAAGRLRVHAVDDPGASLDVDTPADLRRLEECVP